MITKSELQSRLFAEENRAAKLVAENRQLREELEKARTQAATAEKWQGLATGNLHWRDDECPACQVLMRAAAALCDARNGRGEIGGFHGGAAPGYVTEPCPDCAGAGHAKQQEAEEAAAPTYSYSTDGETFYGTFATPEAAAADYLRNGDDDSSVEVGRNERRTANDYVGKHHIESLLEMVGENAYEECGDCAESWLSDMTKDTDQLTELKRVVGDWIQSNDPPGFWHVEDIRRITRAELIASGHLVQPTKGRDGK